MPLAILGLIAVGIYMAIQSTRTAIAYFNGAPKTIVIRDVGNGACLREDAALAFLAMQVACMDAIGVVLMASGPLSGFRTAEQQQTMINSKGSYGDGLGGLAAPVGKSPHQTGRAIDIANVTQGVKGFDTRLRSWLETHAREYGFVNTGAAYITTKEMWHWEYLP